MSSDPKTGDVLAPPAAVGFIGLGQMGRPMAARLVRAGFAVKAYDISETARRDFAEATGTAPVASAAAACAEVAAVITMLPDGKIVRAVLCGEGGALAAADPGTVVIDMSSSSPMDTQALAADLEPRGFAVADAPVSGGVKKAVDGSLAIMAGGEAALVARIRPLLAAMGGAIFATGPLGSGHAMKALNNYVSAAGFVAACEAILIGGRFGLDPAVIVDVLNASTGRNNSTENKMKQQVLSGAFASGFALNLMAKDLRTAADIARHLGVAAPLSEVCQGLWGEADAALGPGADHTAIHRYLSEREAEEDAAPPALYAHPFSSYCQKVLIALYENATPFTYRLLGPEDPAAMAELEALWPLKRFPLLVDGGRPVIESSVIIEHLDRHRPGPLRLIPAAPEAALEVRKMDRFFDNYVMTPMQRIVADFMRPPEHRDPYGVERETAMLESAYRWLDGVMKDRQWAAGECFTLADCAAAPSLFYADWVHPIAGDMAAARAYRARLLARPSVARAVDEARPYRSFFPPGAPDRD